MVMFIHGSIIFDTSPQISTLNSFSFFSVLYKREQNRPPHAAYLFDGLSEFHCALCISYVDS